MRPPSAAAHPQHASVWRSTLQHAAPAVILASLLLVPFLGKAHTIDDVTFLLQANHVLQDPLHPTAFEMVVDGERMRLSSALASGPIMAYLLVPSVMLGGAEWVAHITQLFFIILAAIATARIAAHLGMTPTEGRWAALILVSTPAVAVLATTSMADVPAMALSAIGIERLLAWRRDSHWTQAVAAALCLALAALSRSQHLMMLGVAAIALGIGPKSTNALRSKWIQWLPLVGTMLLYVIVIRITADPQAGQHDLVSVIMARFEATYLASNLLAFAVHWSLVLPLAIPWALVHWKRIVTRPYLYIGILAAALVLSTSGYGRVKSIAPIAGLGVAVLVDIVATAWRDQERRQLLLAAWLFVALPAAAYYHLPAKLLGVSAPAVALLVAGAASSLSAVGQRIITTATVLGGVVLSVLVIQVDAQFGEAGRRAAQDLIAPRVRAGERVWVNGAWGFQWYALQAGAQPLAAEGPHPAPGDIIVSSSGTPSLSLDGFPDWILLERRREESRSGRIMAASHGAGFYSNRWGFLPWIPVGGQIEEITVWRAQ